MNPPSYNFLVLSVPDYGKSYSPYFSFGFEGTDNVVTVFMALRKFTVFVVLYIIDVICFDRTLYAGICVRCVSWSESP